MVNSVPEDSEEKPLDPATARVEIRLRRLMLIAGLTLGVGILAVLAGVIYRINRTTDNAPAISEAVPAVPVAVLPPPQPASAPVPAAENPAPVLRTGAASVPGDARLVSSTGAGERIILTYDHVDGTTVLIVDPQTVTVVGRLEVTPE